MKTSSEGFQQCYNAQTVVDGDNQVVVATTVTDSASDQGQLIPMVDAVRDAFGETPEQVLADAGYCSEPNLQALKERDIDGYVSLAREGTAVMDPDPDKYPAKARMAKKLASEEGRRAVRTPQVDGRGACRLDQGGDGISTIQLPGLGEGPGRMGPRVPSPQRQAAAHPPGRLSAPWPTPSRR